MKISMTHSHLQAEELINREYPALLAEVKAAVDAVDAEAAKTKPDKHNPGKFLFETKSLSKAFDREFLSRGWKSSRCSYYVTLRREWIHQLRTMSPEEQKAFLLRKGEKDPLYRFGEADYLKEKVTAEVQFGNHLRVVNDLYVKHSLFYTAELTLAGIEILPVRKMQAEMNSATTMFEAEVYHLIRQGDQYPPVPLLILGVEP